MDLISILIGGGIGGIVGVVIGAMTGKGKTASLESRVNELEAERDKVAKQLKSGESELQKAKKKAEELDQALNKSKKSLKDAESAKKKHLDEAKKLEKKAAEIESQAKQAESKAKQLEAKASEVESKAKELEKEAAEKAAQVNKLKEDLAAAGTEEAATFDEVKGDLDGILKLLCEHEGQEAAVIADANGIVVAAFGDAGVKEGMAAAANRITKIGEQLNGMVDFEAVSTFRISDAGNKVIAGRTFDIAGEMLALATVGAKMPSDRSLDGAMESLHATLS